MQLRAGRSCSLELHGLLNTICWSDSLIFAEAKLLVPLLNLFSEGSYLAGSVQQVPKFISAGVLKEPNSTKGASVVLNVASPLQLPLLGGLFWI